MISAVLSVSATWAIAAAVMLAVFAGLSVDQLRDLARAAVRSASPAMWLVPAVLFLRSNDPFEIGFGLLLAANAMRLLVSARPPHKLGSATSKRIRRLSNPFTSETIPMIAGALVLQLGLAAAIFHHTLIAGGLIAVAAAILTAGSVARGAHRAQATRPGAIATWLVSMGLTMLHLQPIQPQAAPVRATSVTPLAGNVDPKALRPIPGKSLVSGVVLRPKTKPAKIEPIRIVATSVRGILPSRPLGLPFTGEYYLFPASSGGIQRDSTVLPGTPLDAAYVSIAGGSIVTEAYQPFNPPIDLTNCAAIQVHFTTSERLPASATLQLITTTGTTDLGVELFGFEPATQVTLEFAVPSLPANLTVRAIRIAFHRNPGGRSQSAQIAVQRFTFLPRIL